MFRHLAGLCVALVAAGASWHGAAAYSFKVIHPFCSLAGCADGLLPAGGLSLDASGNLYGAASAGGSGGAPGGICDGCGLVFKLKPSATAHWHETVLRSFCLETNCTDGIGPGSDLVRDGSGNLYGIAEAGGTGGVQSGACPWGCGVVFGIPFSNTGAPLYNFCSDDNCTDGRLGFFGSPVAGLVMDRRGNLFGTTPGGGSNSKGMAFELAHKSGKLANIYNFCSQASCADGDAPAGTMIEDGAGNLYGIAGSGGQFGQGAVYELSPGGSGGWQETVIYSFCSQSGCADGYLPLNNLVMDGQGNLYGTTRNGGAGAGGLVYRLAPRSAGQPWRETILYAFCSRKLCADGEIPWAGLVRDKSGNLFGTTALGGRGHACTVGNGCGVVFELTPSAKGPWGETVLHSFCSQKNCSDGEEPWAHLVMDGSGNLYGTALRGGTGTFCKSEEPNGGCGVVFELVH